MQIRWKRLAVLVVAGVGLVGASCFSTSEPEENCSEDSDCPRVQFCEGGKCTVGCWGNPYACDENQVCRETSRGYKKCFAAPGGEDVGLDAEDGGVSGGDGRVLDADGGGSDSDRDVSPQECFTGARCGFAEVCSRDGNCVERCLTDHACEESEICIEARSGGRGCVPAPDDGEEAGGDTSDGDRSDSSGADSDADGEDGGSRDTGGGARDADGGAGDG